MSKLLLSFVVLSLVLLSCSNDKVPAPAIVLQSISVNQDSTINYKDSLGKMPLLNVGDEVEIQLFLDGNGSSLNTLNVSTSNKDIETVLIPSSGDFISDTSFTDLENGRVSFRDGVLDFSMKTKLKVISNEVKGKIKLSFYLSARAECEGGGILELEFRTEDTSASKNPINKQ